MKVNTVELKRLDDENLLLKAAYPNYQCRVLNSDKRVTHAFFTRKGKRLVRDYEFRTSIMDAPAAPIVINIARKHLERVLRFTGKLSEAYHLRTVRVFANGGAIFIEATDGSCAIRTKVGTTSEKYDFTVDAFALKGALELDFRKDVSIMLHKDTVMVFSKGMPEVSITCNPHGFFSLREHPEELGLYMPETYVWDEASKDAWIRDLEREKGWIRFCPNTQVKAQTLKNALNSFDYGLKIYAGNAPHYIGLTDGKTTVSIKGRFLTIF